MNDPTAERLAEFLRAAYEIQALTDQIRRGDPVPLPLPRREFLVSAMRDLLDHGVIEAAA